DDRGSGKPDLLPELADSSKRFREGGVVLAGGVVRLDVDVDPDGFEPRRVRRVADRPSLSFPVDSGLLHVALLRHADPSVEKRIRRRDPVYAIQRVVNGLERPANNPWLAAVLDGFSGLRVVLGVGVQVDPPVRTVGVRRPDQYAFQVLASLICD